MRRGVRIAAQILARTPQTRSTRAMRNARRLLTASLLLAVPSVIFFMACSSDPEKPSVLLDFEGGKADKVVIPQPDTGPDTGPPDTGTDAQLGCYAADGGCNTLMVCGPKVQIIIVQGTLPAATGGTVADGVYVLTAYTGYSTVPPFGPTADWLRETMAINGGQVQLVDERSNGQGLTTDTIAISYLYADGGAPLDASGIDASDASDGGDADASALDAGDAGDAADAADAAPPPTTFIRYDVFLCNKGTLGQFPYSVSGSQLFIDLPGQQVPARLTFTKQ